MVNTDGQIGETRRLAPGELDLDALHARKIEGLTLLNLLGAGASGQVYLATDDAAGGARVAVKILSAYYISRRNSEQRWRREATVLEHLDHPNIVRGIRHGVADGRPYFVMEYIQGETLSGRLRRLGRLSEPEVFEIARGVLLALEAIAAEGIIHRDIKPSNLIVGAGGVVKLMDFGLIKQESDPSVTQSGAILGTPLYVSPEQARAEGTLDIRSDLYSLGVSLFHLVAGEPPFNELNTSLLLTRKVTDDVPDVRRVFREASPGMAEFLKRLCMRDRRKRIQTPREAIEVLEVIRGGDFSVRAETQVEAEGPVVLDSADIAADHTVLQSVVDDSEVQSIPIQLDQHQVLFYEDDESREAYLLLGGSVEVLKAGRRIAVIDEPGSWIGEMSTLRAAPRTATIRALEQARLLRIDEESFKTFLHRRPEIAYKLAAELAERLEHANRQLRSAQRRLHLARHRVREIEQIIDMGD